MQTDDSRMKDMPNNIKFDSYTWKARVLPVFVVLLPVGLAASLWFPNFVFVERLVGALAAPFGLAMLLSQIGRDFGYRKQPALWTRWGGAPTTQQLRHRTDNSNPVLLKRYHDRLSLLRPDLCLPSAAEETRDPAQADHVYAACVQFLISQTRDRATFPLLYKENVNYGFRRNLWGLKPLGMTVVACCLIAAIWRAGVLQSSGVELKSELLVNMVVSFMLLIFWTLWVTQKWVRIPAEAYAARLLECCEQLEPPRRT
jgi:hypothetical protein